jgi:hypothetical protein
MAEIKTLMGILNRVHPQGDMIPACIQALPEVIGDSLTEVDIDIGRLLAVTVKALDACVNATPKRRDSLIQLATQAAHRALWLSAFDDTNPDHTK